MFKLKIFILNKISQLKTKPFLFLANLFYLFKGTTSRIYFNGTSFIIKDSIGVLYILEKKRYLRYKNGLDSVLESLSMTYCLDKVNFLDGDVFIDCGANIGELGFLLKSKYPNSSYLAFEPSPEEFNILQHNMINSNSRLYNIGLWNNNDVLKFYIASATADSSLIPIENYSSVIEVPVRRLDSIPDLPEKIKLLKIEAEGAEPEVLEGAIGVLSKCQFIVVDTSPERGVKQEETTSSVVNFLLKRGFELISITHGKRIICLFKNELIS